MAQTPDNAHPSSDGDPTVSMDDVLRAQADLQEEAAEAIPFSFSSCTWSGIDEARQPVFSCLSCRPSASSITSSKGDINDNGSAPKDKQAAQGDNGSERVRGGVCAGCSVACHAECELVELFTRRDFVCDCGTARLPAQKCTITLRSNDAPAEANRYDGNFDGVFCACHVRYDPDTEEDEMVQCLVCEDWFHAAKCLSPPGVTLEPESFDTLVCEGCLQGPLRNSIARYAGRPGFMLLREDGAFFPLPVSSEEAEQPRRDSVTHVGSPPRVSSAPSIGATGRGRVAKRSLSPETDSPESKKAKLGNDGPRATCTAPPDVNEMLSSWPSKKNLYMAEGWRERLCRCEKCMLTYAKKPYLLEEEDVYEPPADPDSTKTLEELGTSALLSMPRERAVQGLEAYAGMRDRLASFLEPFAREGRVVAKGDVERFFEMQRQKSG